MFEKMKARKKAKEQTIEVIDREINEAFVSGSMDATDMFNLYEKRRMVELNGSKPLELGDVLKIAGNVAVVAVLVGFEMHNVLNQKGSRFIKVL